MPQHCSGNKIPCEHDDGCGSVTRVCVTSKQCYEAEKVGHGSVSLKCKTVRKSCGATAERQTVA